MTCGLRLPALVASAGLIGCVSLLAACTPAPRPSDQEPRAWLESVCPADAGYTDDFDGLRMLTEIGIDEQLRCEWSGQDGDEETIDAYVVREDPDSALTNTADSYQSGDGIAPDWLYRDLGGGRWGVVFTYDSGRSLEQLETTGFIR